MTPASSQEPQPQDPTPQRARRIMLGTRPQGREAKDRIGKGGGGAKKRKKPRKRYRRDVECWGDLGGNREKHRQESVGSIAAEAANLENSKEARKKAKTLRAKEELYKRRECAFFVASDKAFP